MSGKFNIPINKQVIDAAPGMHGAGCYGAPCGLVEKALMFYGIFGRHNNLEDWNTEKLCRLYAHDFEDKFHSLLCRELRPGGLNKNDAPHLCEQLTNRAILFFIKFIDVHLNDQR